MILALAGLSNAVPEIIHDCMRGGQFELRNVHNADKGMSPCKSGAMKRKNAMWLP